MSRKLIIPIIIIVAALAVIVPQVVEELRRVRTGASGQAPNDLGTARAEEGGERRDGRDQNGDLSERDEQRETFQLEPGARVEIENISGMVEVEAVETGNTAEVHIVRSARSRSDLERRRITVEGSPTSVTVRGESNGMSSIWSAGGGDVRQRVMLRLPRRIDFVATDIHGRARVGEIDGSVEMRDINGGVEIAGARGRAELVEINGRVGITMQSLGSEGIQLHDINGGIELRFAGEVNADVQAAENNGAVEILLPNVVMHERRNRSNFRARIGSGGPLIRVNGVNGRVRLIPLALVPRANGN